MELFRRFPNFHPLPKDEQHFIQPGERSQYPAFAGDFTTLDKELMPYFRELDNKALHAQNLYRWMYVFLIFGGALVTILGIVRIAFINVVGIGIAGAVIAAILGVVTSLLSSFHYHERYLNARLAAERLRSEYFLFLGHCEHYDDDHSRISNLVQRVANIVKQGN
jgi:hypothetical protein